MWFPCEPQEGSSIARFGSLGTQYFDSDGNPLNFGFIQFYEPGTTTPKTTYSDPAELTPNTDPVELEADGRQPNIFFSGPAKGVLMNSASVVIETRDPIGTDGAGSAFSDWSASTVYQLNDLVKASNGTYYISIASDNVGNNPVTSPEEWTSFDLIVNWNEFETYSQYDIVKGSDGLLYSSVINTNLNNNPTAADPTKWIGATPTPSLVTGSLIHLSTVTASTSASVDVDTTFDSTYDSYLLIASGVTTSTDTTTLKATLKLGGAYETGASYSYHVTNSNASSSAYSAAVSTTATGILFNAGANLNTNASDAGANLNLAISINNPASTAFRKLIRWDGSKGGASNPALISGVASFSLASGLAALTGVRFAMSSGNIVTGSFSLYGIKNT